MPRERDIKIIGKVAGLGTTGPFEAKRDQTRYQIFIEALASELKAQGAENGYEQLIRMAEEEGWEQNPFDGWRRILRRVFDGTR